jgi:hypothetical protein
MQRRLKPQPVAECTQRRLHARSALVQFVKLYIYIEIYTYIACLSQLSITQTTNLRRLDDSVNELEMMWMEVVVA